MLILTRRPEESIIIDGNIKIKILSVRGNQVRIGFETPAERFNACVALTG